MKRLRISPWILVFLLFFQFAFAADRLAITTKSRGEASLKRAEDRNFKPQLSNGISLYNKDQVKTGKDGFIALMFIDDKSQVKIREYSEMVIEGRRKDQSISKQINMQFGSLKAEVSEQRKGDFVIATPTSVASVKGTIFWVISDPLTGDTFYGLKGEVEVTNNKSGSVVVVGADQTANSAPDGKVDVGSTVPGTVPQLQEAADEESLNSIKIEFQDGDGNKKNLILEYK